MLKTIVMEIDYKELKLIKNNLLIEIWNYVFGKVKDTVESISELFPYNFRTIFDIPAFIFSVVSKLLNKQNILPINSSFTYRLSKKVHYLVKVIRDNF